MLDPNNPAHFPTVFQLVEIERARMGVAMARIYRMAGFSAVVEAQQGALRALAEDVRSNGGSLGGWIP